ncbi:hypothetical protein [Lishizhenia sp.]|uniref:hypothetical protein n=1 Tax=Lishizhenia sp. TaxID=2497594 RepID=UPI00299D24CE|nr:hypothetical protein [Lishizhenia sp.]MDX1444898.1 hypothetical protein [Lishizhenia sp.]
MKNFSILLFALLMGASCLFAAPADTTKISLKEKTASLLMVEDGKKDFGEGYTRTAIVKFRQALLKDPSNATAAFWVSKCHNTFKNYGYALSYAKDALAIDPKVDDEVFYIIANAYHRMNELDMALNYYQKCKEEMSSYAVSVLRIEERIAECNRAKAAGVTASSNEDVKRILPKAINSGFDDYGAVLSKDGKELYFISRRVDTKGGGVNPDDQRFYEDIYRVDWDMNATSFDSVSNDLALLNSIGFDAINAFNRNGGAAYITLNTSTVEVGRSFTTKGSDLAIARKDENGAWMQPVIIDDANINTSFFEGSATVDKFGNTMIFVSDRNGMEKRSDLYITRKEEGKWTRAVALPDNINTRENETTPFLTPDGKYLFFSSNGLEGYGDYDIYVSKYLGDDKWSDPVNLGPQVNSVTSDTHFQYYPEYGVAFCSSIRLQDEKSSMDLYVFDLKQLTSFSLPK